MNELERLPLAAAMTSWYTSGCYRQIHCHPPRLHFYVRSRADSIRRAASWVVCNHHIYSDSYRRTMPRLVVVCKEQQVGVGRAVGPAHGHLSGRTDGVSEVIVSTVSRALIFGDGMNTDVPVVGGVYRRGRLWPLYEKKDKESIRWDA